LDREAVYRSIDGLAEDSIGAATRPSGY
jgi:hypothetical protein